MLFSTEKTEMINYSEDEMIMENMATVYVSALSHNSP